MSKLRQPRKNRFNHEYLSTWQTQHQGMDEMRVETLRFSGKQNCTSKIKIKISKGTGFQVQNPSSAFNSSAEPLQHLSRRT
jgi:hypothetical protein